MPFKAQGFKSREMSAIVDMPVLVLDAAAGSPILEAIAAAGKPVVEAEKPVLDAVAVKAKNGPKLADFAGAPLMMRALLCYATQNLPEQLDGIAIVLYEIWKTDSPVSYYLQMTQGTVDLLAMVLQIIFGQSGPELLRECLANCTTFKGAENNKHDLMNFMLTFVQDNDPPKRDALSDRSDVSWLLCGLVYADHYKRIDGRGYPLFGFICNGKCACKGVCQCAEKHAKYGRDRFYNENCWYCRKLMRGEKRVYLPTEHQVKQLAQLQAMQALETQLYKLKLHNAALPQQERQVTMFV